MFRAPALYALVLFVALGGTVYAAESSLPQDFLYPIKTEVLEPVVVQLVSFSGGSRGDAHSALVERRLEEAETLIAEGNLEAESVAILADKIEESSASVQEYISNAARKGRLDKALDTGSRLEAVFEAHEEILSSVADEHASSSPEAEDLINAIEEEGDEAEEAAELVEQQLAETSDPEIESYIAELQHRVKKTVDQLQETLLLLSDEGHELTDEALKLLERAKEYQEQSFVFLQNAELEEAFFTLREALNESEKALIILESRENFEAAEEATSSPEK